ncbi:cadmium-translocating P-type ATPase [Inhella crocodyli]|uniref:Cadmium-translocating P-type ATPase n=2 Tax=Inhella crocodyli TaxID=2499851 RepID=A0A437LCH5_9BURK|nr:cadmium-translocating P-type ATPase [Inhella crocodyli]
MGPMDSTAPGDPAIISTPAADGPATARAWAVAGLHCAACADSLADLLRAQPGVQRVDVGYAAALAVVHAPAAVQQGLPEAVRRAGFALAPAQPADAAELRRQEARTLLWRFFVAAFCMMQVMMLAAPTYFASGAEVPPDLRRLLHWGSWVLSWPVMVFSATPFLRGAWRSLRRRQLGMDVPVALGILITFGASTWALGDPTGQAEVYFDSLTMFVAFLLAGRWLELKARHAAAQALADLQGDEAAEVSRERADGGVETVSAERVQAGEVLRVALGEALACDAVLLDGPTQMDEAVLTGESLPVAKRAGDALLGGSVNLGAPVRVRVTRARHDSQGQRLAQSLQQALTERPGLTLEAERWAGPFLAAVLLLALGAGLGWLWVEPSRALMVACATLIVTCPCALALAAPAARVASARALARRGIVLQRLEALETLARVNDVVLDKTGTLTRPSVRPLQTDAPALQAAAQALASWSQHPMARALSRLPQPSAAPPWRWQSVAEQPGAGLRGLDPEGRAWRLGAPAWVEAVSADEEVALAFGREGEPARLRFRRDEEPVPLAARVMQRLRAQGLALRLLSGDRSARVRALGEELGMDAADGDCAPEAKRAAVQALQGQGRCVLMVGDGVNDGPVLAQADVAVAVGGASALAGRAADAVMLRAELSALPDLIVQARRTRRITRQNLAWAAAYNAAAVPLALMGWLPPWAAGLGMALSSALVVLNALRLAR